MCTLLQVLLIDDNPDDRALVLRELQREFPGVKTAAITEPRDLDEALDHGGFDLAITDYQLRWTDGIEVLSAIKDRYPDCPVIMFTATGSEEVAVEAMKNRLDDYVIKNVHHLVRLRAAVKSVLQQAETRRRAAELETRLESLLTQLNVGIFRCTVQGELLEANEAFLKLLGLRSIENTRTIEEAPGSKCGRSGPLGSHCRVSPVGESPGRDSPHRRAILVGSPFSVAKKWNRLVAVEVSQEAHGRSDEDYVRDWSICKRTLSILSH